MKKEKMSSSLMIAFSVEPAVRKRSLRQISSLEINSVGHKKKISIQASRKVFLFYLPQLLHDAFKRIEIIYEICMLLKKILFPVRDGRSFSRKKKHTDRKYRYNLK